jgi:site-specific DNA recombinase
MDGSEPRDYLLYLRKSKGRAGIERQRNETTRHLERQGKRVVAEFVDVDRTAFAKVGAGRPERPDYAAMLQTLQADTSDPPLGVAGWHADRIHRDTAETDDFIKIAAAGHHHVETFRSGSYELWTPVGRKRFRNDAVDAAYEVDHLIERIDAQKAEAAAAGRWLGGRRPFGFEGDGVTHRPGEAGRLLQAHYDVLAGLSLHAIARAWNEAGLPTSTGNRWRATEVRRVLVRPRNAGLMVWRGQIVGRAEWEPVVPEQVWRSVVRLLEDPARRLSPSSERRWLGPSLYLCGVCGQARLVARSSRAGARGNAPAYRCGLGQHISRDAVAVDRLVGRRVVARLSRPDAGRLLVDTERGDLAELEGRLLELREELAGWRADAAAGEVTRIAFKPVEKRLLGEIEDVEARLVRPDRALVLRDLVEAADVGAAWAAYPVDRQRAVVAALLRVTILPAPKGRPKGWRPGEPYFDPAYVDIEPLL